MKKNKKERTRLLPGTVEEKVYCRQKGDHGQMQEHVGESRVDITLSHWRKGGKERERRPKRDWATKMTELYRERQPSPLAGEFRVGIGYTSQSYPVTGRD